MKFLTALIVVLLSSNAFASRACLTKANPFDPNEVKAFLGGYTSFAQVQNGGSLVRTSKEAGYVQISAATNIVSSSFSFSYKDDKGVQHNGVSARVFGYNTDGCNLTFNIVNPQDGKTYGGWIQAEGDGNVPRLAIKIGGGILHANIDMAPKSKTSAPPANTQRRRSIPQEAVPRPYNPPASESQDINDHVLPTQTES